VRSWIAWGVPLLLSFNPLFDYGLSSTRGYILYPFATILSVYLFDRMIERDRPAFLILWFMAVVMNFISYPVTIAVAGGQFVYYVFAARSSLHRSMRLQIDIIFIFLLFVVAAYAPFMSGAVALNIKSAAGMPYPYKVFMSSDLFNLIFAIFLIVWGFKSLRKYRTTVIVSAGCGLLFELMLQALLIMEPAERYFLFIAPVVFASAGILIEKLLVEFRENGKRVIYAASAALVILLTANTLNTMRNCTVSYKTYALMKKSFPAVDLILNRRSDKEKPTVLYPLDFYLTYIFRRCNYNLFDRIPTTCGGRKNEWGVFESHGYYFDIGGFYYFGVENGFEAPKNLVEKNFRIITFGIKMRRGKEILPGSRCSDTELIKEYKLDVIDCVPEGDKGK
jgi:hypothetical protein